MENRSLFGVYNKRISDKLISEGFELKEVRKNEKNEKFNVFYFENTPEFRAAFNTEREKYCVKQ